MHSITGELHEKYMTDLLLWFFMEYEAGGTWKVTAPGGHALNNCVCPEYFHSVTYSRSQGLGFSVCKLTK